PLDGFVTVGEDALFAILGSIGNFGLGNTYRPTAGAVLEPQPAAITVTGLPAFSGQVRRLRARLSLEGTRSAASTGLDSALDDYPGRLAVGAFALRLRPAQVLLVGLAYVAIAGHHSLAQQGPTLAAWRARGVGRLTVLRLLAIEWGVLAVAAVPLGLAG